MYRKLSAPISVHWELTPACNESCVHCYNYWRTDKRLPFVPNVTDIYEAVVTEAIKHKVFSMVITGGEPLIALKQADPYLRRLNVAGITLSLNSNMTLMTPRTANQLKEIGIRGVLASLPSANPETNDRITQISNSVMRISNGIKNALDAGLGVQTNMVVTKENLYQIFETAKHAAELGVKKFSATAGTKPGNCADFSAYGLSPEEAAFMFHELARVKSELGMNVDSLTAVPHCMFDEPEEFALFTKRNCSAGRTFVMISFNGQIRPCPLDCEFYGDIRDGLTAAWDKMDNWRGDDFLPSECSSCPVKSRCQGACRVEAVRNGGTYNASHPWASHNLRRPIQLYEPKTQLHLDTTNGFTVSPSLRFREEDFGGLLYGSSAVPVNQELFNLIVHGKEVVLIDEIASALGASISQIAPTVSYLVRQHVLIPKEGDVTC